MILYLAKTLQIGTAVVEISRLHTFSSESFIDNPIIEQTSQCNPHQLKWNIKMHQKVL